MVGLSDSTVGWVQQCPVKTVRSIALGQFSCQSSMLLGKQAVSRTLLHALTPNSCLELTNHMSIACRKDRCLCHVLAMTKYLHFSKVEFSRSMRSSMILRSLRTTGPLSPRKILHARKTWSALTVPWAWSRMLGCMQASYAIKVLVYATVKSSSPSMLESFVKGQI